MGSRYQIGLSIFSIAVFAFVAASVDAADPQEGAASPATRPTRKPDGWEPLRAKTQSAIDSGDAKQIASAVITLRKEISHMQGRERAIRLLMQNKRYDEAEQLAVDLIRDNASSTQFVAIAEKLRSQSFLAQKKGVEALSAARTYYDVASLKESSDAIDLVALCLALAKPDDPTAAKRFKEQQIVWATVDPTTQPAGMLGDPVLTSIVPDSKPFEGAADHVDLIEYRDFAIKGNLLLLAGKATEARETFERADGAAPDNKQAEAVENIARAIRAESGCVAPANAYILHLRNQQN